MDKFFLDTDICIDILSQREPFFQSTNKLILLTEEKAFKRIISESCIPTLTYLLNEKYKLSYSNEKLINWIKGCDIISSDKEVILKALESEFQDKEDACQYYVALRNDVDYFITRNKKDYEPYATTIPVYTPSEFLEIYHK